MNTKRIMRWGIVLFLLAALPVMTAALAQGKVGHSEEEYPCEGWLVRDNPVSSYYGYIPLIDAPAPPVPSHLAAYFTYEFAFRIPTNGSVVHHHYDASKDSDTDDLYPAIRNRGGFSYAIYKNRELIDGGEIILQAGVPYNLDLYTDGPGIYCYLFEPVIADNGNAIWVELAETVTAVPPPPVSINDRYDVTKDKPLITNSPGVLANDLIANGGQRVFYIGDDKHIYGPGAWNTEAITKANGGLPTDGSSLSATTRGRGAWFVYYFSEDRRINQMAWYDGIWHHFIVTDHAGGPPAAQGSPLSSTTVNGLPHVYYVASHSDGLHVHELSYSSIGEWKHRDVTADTGAPTVAIGSRLSVTTITNGDPRVYYLAADQHVHELAWRSLTNVWYHRDVTVDARGPVAEVGSPISTTTSNKMVRVYFKGSDQHVHELAWWFDKGWQHTDLMNDPNWPLVAAGSELGVTAVGFSNEPRVYYLGADHHVHELARIGDQWTYRDITSAARAPLATDGSSLGVTASKLDSRVYYLTKGLYEKNYVVELAMTAEQWTAYEMPYFWSPSGAIYPIGRTPLATTTVNSGSLNAKLVSGVTHGQLILDPNGSFAYTPDPHYTGIDSFTYATNDGALDSVINSVTLEVTDECKRLRDNLVENFCFAERKAHWRFLTDGKGSFTASPENVFAGKYSARVEIVKPSGRDQLHQSGIELQAGTWYSLSFAAYSSDGRDMSVWLRSHNPGRPNLIYGLRNHVVDLETYWRWYTISFKTPFYFNMDDGQLRFKFATFDTAGTVYHIDRVLLRPLPIP